MDLAFEARLGPGACLIAKVHQQHAIDQATNSYHVLVEERRAYLARHGHIFRTMNPPREAWVALRMVCGMASCRCGATTACCIGCATASFPAGSRSSARRAARFACADPALGGRARERPPHR